jgi:hypothetical protein
MNHISGQLSNMTFAELLQIDGRFYSTTLSTRVATVKHLIIYNHTCKISIESHVITNN